MTQPELKFYFIFVLSENESEIGLASNEPQQQFILAHGRSIFTCPKASGDINHAMIELPDDMTFRSGSNHRTFSSPNNFFPVKNQWATIILVAKICCASWTMNISIGVSASFNVRRLSWHVWKKQRGQLTRTRSYNKIWCRILLNDRIDQTERSRDLFRVLQLVNSRV